MSDDNNEQKIYEAATIAFKKLNANEGDIVVVQFPSDIAETQMQAFAQYMEGSVPDGITVMCTTDAVSIDRLPKEELNKLGWYNFNASSQEIANPN